MVRDIHSFRPLRFHYVRPLNERLKRYSRSNRRLKLDMFFSCLKYTRMTCARYGPQRSSDLGTCAYVAYNECIRVATHTDCAFQGMSATCTWHAQCVLGLRRTRLASFPNTKDANDTLLLRLHCLFVRLPIRPSVIGGGQWAAGGGRRVPAALANTASNKVKRKWILRRSVARRRAGADQAARIASHNTLPISN
ncbi:hypothetical protein EVAR_63650_1 [Eumeta japonica]|uniref:Uncharacterized protein n=1 Tax=Eumeta variegata TaxID=151549 RepID=A0A4C1Z952_EUMVA|nr:hypothetical protein EVAR_63650_1 [Eumeta japonica]